MTATPEPLQIGNATLYLGNCLDVLPTLEPVEVILTDPPYGKVKGDFDDAWTNRVHLLQDAERWLDAMVPVLRFNGTLWWFAWPSLAGRIEARLSERLNPLAHIAWEKPYHTGQKCRKEQLRAPMPATERILMAEHYGADNRALGESGFVAQCDELRGFVFEPLRAYLAGEFKGLGWDGVRLNAICGTASMAGRHYIAKSQWCIPTAEHYAKLQAAARNTPYLRREYEDLRREYEDLRREYEDLRREYEDLRRFFNCERGDQFTDIWRFNPCTEGHAHPTRKPVPLIQYMLKLSARPSACVLDPFMGSGTTGVACAKLGRRFIGIERDPAYFDIACKRIKAAQQQADLFIEPEPAATWQQDRLTL